MNNYRYFFYRLFIVSLLCILFCPDAFAEASLTASVDRTKITIDEQVNLSITANGGTPSEPDIPYNKELEFTPRGTSSQMQITNGSFTSSETYNYQVNPKNTGKLTIPPISSVIDGKKYTTQPIVIEVINAEEKSSVDNSQKIFVTAQVNNKNPYVNQQIIYTFRFYAKVQTELHDIRYPDFKNFWVEDIGKENVYEQIINGERYQVVETTKALYPTKAGQINISPLNFFVEVLYQDDTMGGIFTSTRKEVENYKTHSLKVNVKALPPAPKDFSGIVGHDLKVTTDIDTQTIKAGESANLNIKIQGIANITDLKKFPLKVNDLKVYEDKAVEDANLQGSELLWSKNFKYALVPLKKGQIIVPESSVVYFNVKTNRYETVKSKGYKLFSESAEQSTVQDSKTQTNEKQASSVKNSSQNSIFEEVDINNQSLDKLLIWLLFSAFIASLLFLFYLFFFSEKIKFSELKQNKKSNKKLLQQIRSENSVDNMSRLLKEYLSYKYNINDFSEDSIKANIQDEKISSELVNLINQYNFLKFSGVDNKSKENEIVNNTKNIIEKFEIKK